MTPSKNSGGIFTIGIDTSSGQDCSAISISCSKCKCLVFFGCFMAGQELVFHVPAYCPECHKIK